MYGVYYSEAEDSYTIADTEDIKNTLILEDDAKLLGTAVEFTHATTLREIIIMDKSRRQTWITIKH